MMRNRTKTNWFPAALAIASVCVVSPTVYAVGGDSFPSQKDKSSWSFPFPTIVPMIAHGNNGAPPTPGDIADVFGGHFRALVPEGDIVGELIRADPGATVLGRVGFSDPGAVRALPGSAPSTALDGPSFFDPHPIVGGGPIGQPMGAIPSPGTLALLGLSALALARRRRRT